jgi:hypothetical protein
MRMRHQLLSRLLLAASGIVSVGFGTRFIIREKVEMHTMTREIALYTAALGALLVLFSLALRLDRPPQEIPGLAEG